jgi:tryptophan-rich sensory protein
VPTWYAKIQKPEFNPPNWVFAPVWFTLYLMMGISSYLIWIKGIEKKSVKISLIIFLFQLILNALWTFLFFGLHSPFFAFIDIIALWIVILLVIVNFYKLSKTAGILLIPYILWVSFAGVLNYYIFVLNP